MRTVDTGQCTTDMHHLHKIVLVSVYQYQSYYIEPNKPNTYLLPFTLINLIVCGVLQRCAHATRATEKLRGAQHNVRPIIIRFEVEKKE